MCWVFHFQAFAMLSLPVATPATRETRGLVVFARDQRPRGEKSKCFGGLASLVKSGVLMTKICA